jgi:hypothetical protein
MVCQVIPLAGQRLARAGGYRVACGAGMWSREATAKLHTRRGAQSHGDRAARDGVAGTQVGRMAAAGTFPYGKSA